MTESRLPRFFFAALPDPEARGRIGTDAAALRRAVAVAPVDYHVTLAFVGEVPESQLVPLRHIGASQRARRFTLRLDHYDYWPRARVLVAAASAVPAELASLAQALLADLAAKIPAFQPPPHELKPHVTLARKVMQAPVLPALAPIVWTARAFHLMRSSAPGATPRYTVVDTWPLLDESAAG